MGFLGVYKKLVPLQEIRIPRVGVLCAVTGVETAEPYVNRNYFLAGEPIRDQRSHVGLAARARTQQRNPSVLRRVGVDPVVKVDVLGEVPDQYIVIRAIAQRLLVIGQGLRILGITLRYRAQPLQHFFAAAIQENVPGFRVSPECAEQLIEKQSAVICGDEVPLKDAGRMTLVHANIGVDPFPAQFLAADCRMHVPGEDIPQGIGEQLKVIYRAIISARHDSLSAIRQSDSRIRSDQSYAALAGGKANITGKPARRRLIAPDTSRANAR